MSSSMGQPAEETFPIATIEIQADDQNPDSFQISFEDAVLNLKVISIIFVLDVKSVIHLLLFNGQKGINT